MGITTNEVAVRRVAALAGGDTKDEPEDLVVDFLRQSLLGLAHAGVIRHRVGGREADRRSSAPDPRM